RHQKPTGSRAVVVLRQQFVAGQLHANELAVRHVLVQRANDPVTIVIGAGSKPVELVATAFRVSSGVEPMPRPFFAISGTFEQTIDDVLKCLRRFVLKKGFDLFDAWWQA